MREMREMGFGPEEIEAYESECYMLREELEGNQSTEAAEESYLFMMHHTAGSASYYSAVAKASDAILTNSESEPIIDIMEVMLKQEKEASSAATLGSDLEPLSRTALMSLADPRAA